MGEPLYRVGTGNYEYRLILRCRQEARSRFAKMRKDVLEKMELLDQKHGKCGCFLFRSKWPPRMLSDLDLQMKTIKLLRNKNTGLKKNMFDPERTKISS